MTQTQELTQEDAAKRYLALQEYKRAWYQKRKKQIIKAQRDRYQSDPTFRSKKLERVKSHQRKKQKLETS